MALFYDLKPEMGNRESVTISDGCGMSAHILTYGATVQRLNVPDARGDIKDVILGYDDPAEYDMQDVYFGAVIGRVANRIKDACYFVQGRKVALAPNQPYGMLHGGPEGFAYKTWTVIRKNARSVLLRLYSPDGDQGFPGNLTTDVLYSMDTPGQLSIRYHAVTDFDTPVNLTNHMYFNLDGHESGLVDDHRLMLSSRRYTVTDNDLVPTGEIRPVNGTLLDFSELRRLSPSLHAPEHAVTKGLDHNFVLSTACSDGEVPAAVLKAARSGITMTVYTDRPAMQVYSAGAMSRRSGKDGAVYEPFQAVCLETQGFPDALHHFNFPSIMVKAGESFDSETIYRFTAEED